MNKLILSILLVVSSLFATSQTATYFADSMSYYPYYADDAHIDSAANVRITLRPDSLMIIHDRKKNITGTFRLITKLREEDDSTSTYKALSFFMQKLEPPYEDYIVALVYRKSDLYLHILGITGATGTDMILFFIVPKNGRIPKTGIL